MSDEPIDITIPVWFYDDRSKTDDVFKLKNVIWTDGKHALCVVELIDSNNIDGENYESAQPFLFNIRDGEVLNSDYDSWYATNDISWIKEKNKE